jgi:protein-tyrosine phosphatase
MKKTCAALLTAAMLLGCCPAYAAEGPAPGAGGYAAGFSDVGGSWAENAIENVVSRGLFTGVGGNSFAPNGSMTRAMAAVVLHRMGGAAAASAETKFTDVGSGSYYAGAVGWCAEKGVVSGTSATTFSPSEYVTRQQLAVMIYNYAKAMGYDVTAVRGADSFSDSADIAGWALDAVGWCVGSNVMSGRGGRFEPNGSATRAETAAVIYRLEARFAALGNNRHSIGLTGVSNARELGGYKTTDGRTVKMGALLRTGKLSGAKSSDIAALTYTYGLSKVLDFRTDAEIAAGADPAMAGVKNIHIDILGSSSSSDKSLTGMYSGSGDMVDNLIAMVKYMNNDVDGYIGGTYKKFATDDSAIAGYRRMFAELLDSNGKTVLWHCTGGKDRAGTGAALILSALGADRETIVQDYMLTNDYNAKTLDYLYSAVMKKTGDKAMADNVRLLSGVSRSWIESVLDEIDGRYGSMDNFLRNQMGLTDADIAALRSAYLVG